MKCWFWSSNAIVLFLSKSFKNYVSSNNMEIEDSLANDCPKRPLLPILLTLQQMEASFLGYGSHHLVPTADRLSLKLEIICFTSLCDGYVASFNPARPFEKLRSDMERWNPRHRNFHKFWWPPYLGRNIYHRRAHSKFCPKQLVPQKAWESLRPAHPICRKKRFLPNRPHPFRGRIPLVPSLTPSLQPDSIWEKKFGFAELGNA